MDNFTYNYLNIGSNPSNRLGHVSDAVNASANTDDIESQSTNNYSYDQLGQLIGDQQELIANIEWRSGDKKIKALTRTTTAGNKSDMEFIYNPLGQRVVKIEKTRLNNILESNDKWKYTYYAYDANGQVMATYAVKLSTTVNRATLTEQHLYGASRLGMRRIDKRLYENGTSPNVIPDVQQNTLGSIAYEITNYLGNVNVVISDRKIWNATPTNAFRAVILSKTDYFPFGMEISSRTVVTENYNYGYIGLEKDNEVSGSGNSYNSDYRQYDSRLGRWKSCDPKRHWFPSMSAYCYASNSPIAGKDDNGLYTIFVNGYTGDGRPGNHNEAPPGYQYWRGSKKNPSEFIDAAHDYFGDGLHRFVDGSGDFITSTAWTRQNYGRKLGKKHAEEIKELVKKLNSDSDPTNDITEINFVSHSMGAAVAEGMIEVFMKDEQLKSLLEKGEIVHFSACDGDAIVISNNSKSIKRTQINYFSDLTLIKADFGSINTGGFRIPGVNRFGVVQSNHIDWKKESDYDFHYRSKTFKEAWDFLRIFDKKVNGSNETIKLYKFEVDNWDHREGTKGQTLPNDVG